MRSRLLITLALLLASVAWLGATPLNIVQTPLVVVFPLTVNGDADKNSGDRLATLFAQQMAENGVKVLPPPPGTERKDFLSTARSLGCDYYVSGFITPLGQEVTVVEQLVSTTSGTVIFSNSAEMVTYTDASGQGLVLANAAIRHAGRGLASLGEPPPAATKEPDKDEANLGGLAALFKRKPKAKPSVEPTATVEPVALSKQAETLVLAPAPMSATLPPSSRPAAQPRRGAPAPASTATASGAAAANQFNAGPQVASLPGGRVVLFEVGGTAASDERAYARQMLQTRLAKSGQNVATAGAIDPNQFVSRASDLCTQTGARTLVDSQLTTRSGDAGYGPSTTAQLDVRAIDCSGRLLFADHFERNGTGRHNWERAVEGAVAAAAVPLANAIR